MDLSSLTAISPIDGRYRNKVEELDEYFSEFALIKYRVLVEIKYFISLYKLKLPQLAGIKETNIEKLENIYKKFSIEDALKIKTIESNINHDVKAVEYFLKEKFDEYKLAEYKEFIHFGLTSQDINNTAIPYSFKEALNDIYYPLLEKVITKMQNMADEWKNIPMLAKTHGQPASPTKLGKEIQVFIERIKKQKSLMQLIPVSAKFGGATGNFNAHNVAFPDIDWNEFGNIFVNNTLKLNRSYPTTQIEHYDNFAAFFDNLKRINTILIDFNRDIWTYISNEYFKQKINKNEVGSSAMPHKVNPIDFENSEGNLGVANAMFEQLASKLPVSRLQRDLTDSTVFRTIGVPFAHTVIAFKSLLKGLEKLVVNKEKIHEELENNWAVVAEAIQTVLRRENYLNPYETLKNLTRNTNKINKKQIHDFIENLDIDNATKNELKNITPFNYTGI